MCVCAGGFPSALLVEARALQSTLRRLFPLSLRTTGAGTSSTAAMQGEGEGEGEGNGGIPISQQQRVRLIQQLSLLKVMTDNRQ